MVLSLFVRESRGRGRTAEQLVGERIVSSCVESAIPTPCAIIDVCRGVVTSGFVAQFMKETGDS